jgi:diguanylate cyclase (GGDEF)-like protein
MSELDPTVRGGPPESVHAQQLKRGFPYLIFNEPLEREFRAAYQRQVLSQVRINLWLAVAFVLAFAVLTHLLLADSATPAIILIQTLLLAPLLLGALVMAYVPRFQRFYSPAAKIGGPVFGVGLVLLEVMAWKHGVSLVSTVVIATIFTYLMMGQLFYAATRSALIILVAYVVLASNAGIPGPELASNITVLVFANLIGGTVCYTLERANRTNYLESCLLIEVASRDGLTGINNRRAFDEHMDKIWQQAIPDHASLALMLIDIDHFKAFNDYYGHQAGDECLKQVAWTLMRCARRPLDVTARYGGEEFAVVLYDARRAHVEEVARQIQAALETLNVPHAASPSSAKRVTVSIGAACVEPSPHRSHFGFIQLADEALYEAKGRGRNCLVVMDKEYDDLSTGSFRKNERGRIAAS